MYSGRYHFDVPNTFLFVFFDCYFHSLAFVPPVAYKTNVSVSYTDIPNIYYLYDIGLILGSIKYRIIHTKGK